MQDLDVTMIHRMLEACGLKLRSDDPASMKEFVLEVHNRAAQLSREGRCASLLFVSPNGDAKVN